MKSKPIVAINIETNEKLNFNSVLQASKTLRINRQKISDVLQHKLASVDGYVFVEFTLEHNETFTYNEDITGEFITPLQSLEEPSLRAKINSYINDLKTALEAMLAVLKKMIPSI